MANTYTIKPLEWNKYDDSRLDAIGVAVDTRYSIRPILEGFKGEELSGGLVHLLVTSKTLEEAKESCQKHYEGKCLRISWLSVVEQ